MRCITRRAIWYEVAVGSRHISRSSREWLVARYRPACMRGRRIGIHRIVLVFGKIRRHETCLIRFRLERTRRCAKRLIQDAWTMIQLLEIRMNGFFWLPKAIKSQV